MQNMTLSVLIPQSNPQPPNYVEFSYRGWGLSDYYYYWSSSNMLYLTVTYDGIPHQVFPNANNWWTTGEAVDDWTLFRYLFPTCTKPGAGGCQYDVTWSFIIKGSQPSGAGAAVDSILIVGTQGNNPKCAACPAGSCSPSGSLGCTPCPLGSFSVAPGGAATCAACANSLPDRARYTLLGDSLGTCPITCGPGYQLNAQKQCAPNPDLCYMPSRDRVMDSNHYYPTTLTMLSQCLTSYVVPTAVMSKTIDSVIEMVSQYSNLTKGFLGSLQAIQKNVLTSYANL